MTARTPTFYWPLVISSIACGIVAVPAGVMITLVAAFSGMCDDDGQCGHPVSGLAYASYIGIALVIWAAVVLLIVGGRDDPVSLRHKIAGLATTVVVFAMVLVSLGRGHGFRSTFDLVFAVILLPVFAALLGGFVTQALDAQRG